GDWLDTAGTCPSLTTAERTKLQKLKAKAERRIAPAAAKARSGFIAKHAKALADRTGVSMKEAQHTIAHQCDGVLLPPIELPFDNAALAGCTVADVLADPDRFEGEMLADPIEGGDYGAG